MQRMCALVCLGLLLGCSRDDDMTMIPIQAITILGEEITDGQSSQLTANITPVNATVTDVTWSVSDTGIATITPSGLLHAVANGPVMVTATAKDASGVTGTRLFNISGVSVDPVLVTGIEIQGGNISDGMPTQYDVLVLPEDADNKSVTWSVVPDSLATISPSGLLVPLHNGIATVTATALDGSGVSGMKQIDISGILDTLDGVEVGTAAEILAALAQAEPGDKIYVHGGTYKFNTTIQLNGSGLPGQPICLLAHPDNTMRPLFDFSAMNENSSNRGLLLTGDYWCIKGIDVYHAGDNGLFIRGSYNVIEFCTFYENADTGLQIGNGASHNKVINCDSYYNADSSIENADGFACKLDAGTGNSFSGCRAWQNLDDGWDGYLRGADNITTTYDNCWAFLNGRLKNGQVSGGDGNGFKTGGSDDKLLKHHGIFTQCVSAGNVVDGFDHNSNRGAVILYNCSAHQNGRNINFSSTNIAAVLKIKNTVSFAGNNSDSYNATSKDLTNNSWQDGLSATDADFLSVDFNELMAPRKADGSLPDIGYLHLVEGSDLIDQGIDVGLEYNGVAPDIGAFEY